MHTQNLGAFYYNRDTEEQVRKICSPIFDQFNITHFGYININSSGEMLRLATDTKWTKIYFDNFLYNDPSMYVPSYEKKPHRKKIIFSGYPKTTHEKFLYEHNFWNCLAVHEFLEQEKNFWFFCSHPQHTFVINYYLNYPDIFDHFTNYFLSKAQYLIKTADRERRIKTTLSIQPLSSPILLSRGEKNQLPHKRNTPISINNILLSTRELDCLSLLLRGRSMKEISNALNISARTVETHINKLKAKTSLSNKQMLVDFFLPYRALILSQFQERDFLSKETSFLES